MKQQPNHQRVLASMAAFAFATIQVPAPAFAASAGIATPTTSDVINTVVPVAVAVVAAIAIVAAFVVKRKNK